MHIANSRCQGHEPFYPIFPAPRDAAWLFLTVFIALTGFLTEFFLSDPMYGIHRQPPPPVDGKLLMQLLYHGELPTPPRFRFMVSVTWFPTVRGRILDFVELCNILYTAGPATFEFALWQACLPLFTQGGARNKFLAFHWTLKWIFHNRANYFHPGANAVRSHGCRNS